MQMWLLFKVNQRLWQHLMLFAIGCIIRGTNFSRSKLMMTHTMIVIISVCMYNEWFWLYFAPTVEWWRNIRERGWTTWIWNWRWQEGPYWSGLCLEDHVIIMWLQLYVHVRFISLSLQGSGEGEGVEGEDEVTDTGEKKHTSSIAGASMNFINSIIGSGIIGTYRVIRILCSGLQRVKSTKALHQ